MKYTSIVTTAALATFPWFDVVAAAASRTRGIDRADDQEGHQHRRALSPENSKAGGKGGSCHSKCEDGAVYYKYTRFNDVTSFDVALESAPKNCVLAPVTSSADLLEIVSVIPTTAFQSPFGNAWVGIGKSAEEVLADKTKTVEQKRKDWFNLDGSQVPENQGLWLPQEPNNALDYQTRAFLDVGSEQRLLGDINPQGFRIGGAQVKAAVYKCCYDLCTKGPIDV